MAIVSAPSAASLAEEVYVVSSSFDLLGLFARKEFSNQSCNQKLLTAEVGTRLINTRDAFGICARGAGQFANDLFLIFRGTTASNYGADIFTDARTGLNVSVTGSLVHAGFNQTFNSLRNDLAEFIGQQTNVRTIHCIGHSLGGAVANLAADWVSDSYAAEVRLYTFGAPRVGLGTSGFAANLTAKLGVKNIHRVYHGTDPVPMVPLFPFIHAPNSGWSYYLPYGGVVINFSAHRITSYITSIGSRDWSSLYQPEPGFSTDVKAWLQGNSDENAQSATFWNKLNQAAAFVVQAVLSVVALPIVAGLTVADYLSMILVKGISLAADVSKWVFLLVRKMMRMLGMAVIETVEDLTVQLIRLVLDRVMKRIYDEVRKAIKGL